MLSILLLGGFRLTVDGEIDPSLLRPRGKALLAYLLLHHTTPQDRAHLAYTFWPETSDSQARTNLRRELHQLRHSSPLFAALIQSGGQSVQWQMPTGSTLDVAEFTRLVTAAGQATDPATRIENYRAAIELYQGDLLPSLYDEWILPIREELRQTYIRALETLTALLVNEREYGAATTLTQRLLQYDPLYEAGYRQLMQLYALQQDRARALHTYHSCVTVLGRELGVPPSAEIEQLYQQLLHAEPQLAGAHRPNPATALQLVGRKAEWQTLLDTWRQAAQGRAHTVLIEGEAGIGKTRLAEELLDWVNRQGILTARTRSYAAEGALAYAPVIEWLRSPALRTTVAQLDPIWRTELARLLPELLTAFPDLPCPEPLTERWQRQRLFEALARAITVDEQPKLLLIDDLQWCDQETVEWLRFLAHFACDEPLLVLGTVRSEEVEDTHPLYAFRRELRISNQLTVIDLSPLDSEETTALATQVWGDYLDEETTKRLMRASEGNPLFVVEMVQSGVWTTPLPALPNSDNEPQTLPPKVYAVIQQRLTQLTPPARQLVAVAATIGRSFDFAVLVQASGKTEDEVVSALDELWRRRVIREQGLHEYDFSHDRIRETAYAELSTVRRKHLHQRVAQALESLLVGDLDSVSGQLAFHYEQAGLFEQAIQWYQRAGQAASQRFAHAEAVTHLESGLTLLDRWPDDQQHAPLKLQLLLLLDNEVVHSEGLVSLRRTPILQRKQKLAVQLQHDACLCDTLGNLSFFYQAFGELQKARKVTEEHLLLVERREDSTQRARAYLRLGCVTMSTGSFQESNRAFEMARAWHDKCAPPLQNGPAWKQYSSGIDRFWVNILWIVGFPERAQEAARRILLSASELTAADRSNIPFFAAILYRNLRLHRQLTEQVEILNHTGKEYSMWLSKQSGMVFQGWVLAQQGDLHAGIALTERGVERFRNVGQTIFQTHRLAMLAEMQLMAHDFNATQATLDEALTISQEKGERFWDVELYRLQGDLLLAQNAPAPQVEQSYLRAIAIAQQQGAKSLELRATTALCRLLQQQGRIHEAHQALSPIYNWFTEGFNTYDLRVARELLTELASPAQTASVSSATGEQPC